MSNIFERYNMTLQVLAFVALMSLPLLGAPGCFADGVGKSTAERDWVVSGKNPPLKWVVEPGTTVQLLSGGPVMTVRWIQRDGTIHCDWIDLSGDLQNASFDHRELKTAE